MRALGTANIYRNQFVGYIVPHSLNPPITLYTHTANMTSAHIAPHVENLGNAISQWHGHIESGHEAPHGGICDGINAFSLHFLQIAAHVKKSFPEAERPHFYVDLNKEGESGLKASQKFNEMMPTLLTQGVKASDVVLALEGEMIAMIAMYDSLKAADPKYEEHCAFLENYTMKLVQDMIDTYSKA
ncbi:hypothetical protein FIBSPDRAFT_1036774 [Athelia psychrophila]|uniref:Uncharacterized protein n=1 Tax=Athelia psychrophila TaxID=1759441 RepID=A0A166VF72_9AGAM|nr:hypothetical protein FIBSPDRAFT_1036774 [Fibularhizoctonia sp. CBS 109695]